MENQIVIVDGCLTSAFKDAIIDAFNKHKESKKETDKLDADRKVLQEQLMKAMEELGIFEIDLDDIKVSYSRWSYTEEYDIEAMRKDGIDVDKYVYAKEKNPSIRVTVRNAKGKK